MPTANRIFPMQDTTVVKTTAKTLKYVLIIIQLSVHVPCFAKAIMLGNKLNIVEALGPGF